MGTPWTRGLVATQDQQAATNMPCARPPVSESKAARSSFSYFNPAVQGSDDENTNWLPSSSGDGSRCHLDHGIRLLGASERPDPELQQPAHGDQPVGNDSQYLQCQFGTVRKAVH